MFGKEQERQYALIVAKTWIDPQFRERFIAQPREVLEQYGIDIPKGFDVRVNPDSSQATATIELGIPPKPQVADEHIERMLILDAAKCLCADFCTCNKPPPPRCYCGSSALAGGCTCKTSCRTCYEAESGKCTCRTCRTCYEEESGKCICKGGRTCYEADAGKCAPPCRLCWEDDDERPGCV